MGEKKAKTAAYTVNGIGTTFFGEKNFGQDEEYIWHETTKWFVIFWFPIFPIASYIMIEKRQKKPLGFFDDPFTKEFQLIERPLDWPQIRRTYWFQPLWQIWTLIKMFGLIFLVLMVILFLVFVFDK